MGISTFWETLVPWMGRIFKILFFVLTLAEFASATPALFSYQGRILNSSGQGFEHGNVSFEFSIMAADSSCILYQEVKNGVDMRGSKGVFDTAIGEGVRSFPSATSPSLLEVFDNSRTQTCRDGSTYTPVPGAGRRLRVQFYDGQEWRLITPDTQIRSVPFAGQSLNALQFAGRGVTDFILRSQVPGAACTTGQVITFDGSQFSCVADQGGLGVVTNVTGTPPVTVSGTGNITIGVSVGTTAGTLAAGDDARFSNSRSPSGAAGGDLTGNYPNPTIAADAVTTTKVINGAITNAKLADNSVTSAKIMDATIGVADFAIGSATGQVFRYSGAAWQMTKLNYQDLVNNSGASPWPGSCSAGQYITWLSVADGFSCVSFNSSAVTTALGFTPVNSTRVISTGTAATTGLVGGGDLSADRNLAVNVGTGANQIPQLNASGRLVNAVLPAFTGDVTSSAGSNTLSISSIPVSKISSATGAYLTYAPNNVACADGEVLKWNTTDSRWVCGTDNTSAGGGVTSVTGSAPITIGGTASAPQVQVSAATTSATGVVQLATSSDTGAGRVVQANDTRLTDSRAPSGSASGDLSGSYPSPTVAGIRGQAVTLTSVASGHILRHNGSAWVNVLLSSAALSDQNSLVKYSDMASCSASQTLTFTSPSNVFSCTNISVSGSAFGSQTANRILASPNGAAGTPTFRSLVTADMPAPLQTWGVNAENEVYNLSSVVIGTTDLTGVRFGVQGGEISGFLGETTGDNQNAVQGRSSGINSTGVRGDVAAGGTGIGVVGHNQDAGGTGYLGASGWGVYCFAGTCGGGAAWTQVSDVRLKRNVATLENALEKVLKLRGVSYRWKDETKNQREGEKVGLIAQEVQAVFPQTIVENKLDKTIEGGTLAVSYSELVSPLIEAVKEFYGKYLVTDAEVQNLKATVDILRDENANLKNEIRTLKEGQTSLTQWICSKDPQAGPCK